MAADTAATAATHMHVCQKDLIYCNFSSVDVSQSLALSKSQASKGKKQTRHEEIEGNCPPPLLA
jgi:hypothetical protein